MNTVSSQAGGVNGYAAENSVEAVIAWVEAQAAKADLGAAGARVRVTSISQISE